MRLPSAACTSSVHRWLFAEDIERRLRTQLTGAPGSRSLAGGAQERLRPATASRASGVGGSRSSSSGDGLGAGAGAACHASRLARQSGAAALLKRVTILSVDSVVASLLLLACVAQPGALSATLLVACVAAATSMLLCASAPQPRASAGRGGGRGVGSVPAHARLLQAVAALWLLADYLCRVGDDATPPALEARGSGTALCTLHRCFTSSCSAHHPLS